MKTQRKFCTAAGLAAALALGGCWGGDDDAPAPVVVGNGVAVPDSAGASTGAFVGYLLVLLGTSDESSEPSAISTSFEVPPDEAAEPQPLT